MHKIVAVIPARAGSKGVVDKNIRDLCEQPLIAYSILDGVLCKKIEEVYMSTDSEEIAQIGLKYGAEVPFLRPKKYTKDNSADIEWVIHFLNWYKDRYETYPSYIVHLRATTPFREIKVIEKAIELIESKPDATSLVSVQELDEVYKSFTISKNSEYLEALFDLRYHLMPRQAFDPVYKANGYVDILKPGTVLGGSLHGEKILSFITDEVPEIDNKKDFDYAEFIGRKIL